MKLKKETFQKLVDTVFTITFDAQNKYDVQLIEFTELQPIKSLNVEPFTLLFRGAVGEKIFEQHIYTLHSEATGTFEAFLVPLRPDDKGVYYELIVS